MMKKHEFTNGELTEKAMEVYSNSSFTFWEDGKHYCFRSLNFWLRENCEELFDCAPDSAQFRSITSGLSRVKRCVMGKLPPDQRPGYTYKGWTVVPTGDDRHRYSARQTK